MMKFDSDLLFDSPNVREFISKFEDIQKFKNSGKIIYVYRMLPHLRYLFTYFCFESRGLSVIYANRESLDIVRFFESLQICETNGEAYARAGLEVTLEKLGFRRTPSVQSKGDWAIRGDSIYFWPIGYEHPLRAEYFDERLEKVIEYDEVYGTTITPLTSFALGDISKIEDSNDREEIKMIGDKSKSFLAPVIFSQNLEPESISGSLSFDFVYPPLYFNRFDLVESEWQFLEREGYHLGILSKNSDEIPDKFRKYLVQGIICGDFVLNAEDVPAGILSRERKVFLITDRELFGTFSISREKHGLVTQQARELLDQLEGDVNIGDYLVHIDHGVGIYQGLVQEKRTISKLKNFNHHMITQTEDYIKLTYAEGDELLIPLSQVQKITKYIGTTNEPPEITRLHKGNWKKIVAKTRKSIQLIASDLVEHYAKLQLAQAHGVVSTSSDEYKQFVEDFEYIETADQERTIKEVILDLDSQMPMNRLIVGDVGFGKTEVAMRAAFKIVESGMQVAVLCPTTVLAAQHYKVFKDRFDKFGIDVEYVSRFNSASENKQVLAMLKTGKVPIIIGTHRLLSQDVEFKSLGLVIIDEEQKFGVKQKERLRKLQYGAHSLMMTATPIPRTLSMALSQIQSISIIATPPSQRKSVETKVLKFDWNKIVEQIQYESSRGGQVYFVHNRVETIESILHQLKVLMPGIRFAIAHGQMPPARLDEIIKLFYERKFDVLICTTIIENGIDMPNVNTMIIDKGENFGLGQLYQLRGRVGRSSVQAYCYIYYSGNLDQASKHSEATDVESELESRKHKDLKYIQRLQAILEAQDLGAGFRLASRDLEIRGAGNLLGKEQHGNIRNVGLALYMQMLAEEIEKRKIINESLLNSK